MTERKVYLDYNATTPIRREVEDVLRRSLAMSGNASSMHAAGRAARAEVEKARLNVARLVGSASPLEIIFTSGGSESNNTVFETARAILTGGAASLCSTTLSKQLAGRNEVITTDIEHPCVLNSAKYLETLGYKVTFLGVDGAGRIKLDELKSALSEKTLLVSIMYANNEIGTVEDIAGIAPLVKKAGSLFHTDAVQAVGKLPIDVAALGVDYLTMSCHKIYGPKGVGALYKKEGAPLAPLIHGGHQEDGYRAGTYNTLGIAGFGEAARLAALEVEEYGREMRALRDKLRDALVAGVPNIKVNGHAESVLPNTLNVSFPGAEGEAILLSLDMEGIEVSTGSACASGSLEPSHVLMALGLDAELAHGSIRFSLGRGTASADIDYTLSVVPRVIQRLRSMSSAV